MTVANDRLLLIRAAIAAITPPKNPIVPTPAEIDAGFTVAKAAINAMVSQLVPPWALGYVNITDDEIHAVSDAVAQAVLNT